MLFVEFGRNSLTAVVQLSLLPCVGR